MIDPGELGLSGFAEMVAHQDQCQVGILKQAFLYNIRVFLVQSGGALVDEKDAAVVDQRPGNGDALLLEQ